MQSPDRYPIQGREEGFPVDLSSQGRHSRPKGGSCLHRGSATAYSLLESAVDVKGIAYEEIVGANLRGDRGEFFTPRNACRMAVAMTDPKPGQRILDPCCGTGGFLITAMNAVLE